MTTASLEPKTYKRARSVAFVASPTSRSAWLKTHAAVALVPCHECKAAIGQLCEPSFGFHVGSTHGARRRSVRHALIPPTVIVQKDAVS